MSLSHFYHCHIATFVSVTLTNFARELGTDYTDYTDYTGAALDLFDPPEDIVTILAVPLEAFVVNDTALNSA
jgi:hypothetical protein